jgi:sulfate adenylyltransferase large subunit
MDKEIMRIVTMGSVDDGKSTLIGRLLYETNSIYEDQLKAVQVASLKRKMKDIDYSLLLDGLSSEREQGITIDVAHRYFETDRKRFIVADCPGHEQYTKNAFTGASVSNVGLILIDAEKGIREQSKRHCFISSLLGLSHLIFVINKMDLVNYSEEAYTVIKNEMILYLKKLNFGNYFFIPVSSIYGDNIVQGSCQMNWYQDNTVLDYLNTLTINNSNNIIDFRFPIQNVIRTSNFRGYAGKIVSGSIKLNEKIIILPSMKKTEVKDIIYNNKLTTGSSVILQLKDEIDISHGDMIVRENNIPKISNNFSCMICWMGEKSLAEGDEYILKQTTKKVNVKIRQVEYKLNIDTLHRESSTTLLLNDIGKVLLECDEDLFLDEY